MTTGTNLIGAGFAVAPDVEARTLDHTELYRSAVAVLDNTVNLHFNTAESAERVAQACLDAANLLRDKADPPATIQRVEDVPPADVAAALAPYTDVVLAPVLGTAGDGPVVARLHAAEVPGVAR